MSDTGDSDETSARWSRQRGIRLNALVSVCLVGAVCLIRILANLRLISGGLYLRELWLWIVILNLGLLSLLFLTRRQGLGILRGFAALLPNLALFVVVGLLFFQQFDAVALWVLESAVCFGHVAGWSVMVLGGVGVLRWLHQARRREHRQTLPTWVRYWMAASTFVVTAEFAAGLLRPTEVQSRLILPESYADAEDQRFQIAAVGGSTMAGFPYQPKVSIPLVLAESLRRINPAQQITVTNVAQTGVNFRHAAEALATIRTKPDLLLVYTGHNEYFYNVPHLLEEQRWPRQVCDPLMSWSRSYEFLTSVIPQPHREVIYTGQYVVNHGSTFTDEAVAERLKQFRHELSLFADHCRRFDIPVLWFLPATNEGQFLPRRSACSQTLNPDEERLLNAGYRQARELIDEREYAAARSRLEQLDADYPGLAEIEFWLAVCDRELGDVASAQRHFQQAIDEDAKPSYANSAYRGVIRDVADEHGCEYIDAAVVLRGISPSGLLDRHVIHDNVHPTLRGSYALGCAALQSATVAALIPPEPDRSFKPIGFSEFLTQQNLTPDDLALAYERTAACFDFHSRFRVAPGDEQAAMLQYEQWADGLQRGDLHPGDDGTESFADDSPPGVQFPE